MAQALRNLLVDYIQKREIRADEQQGDTGPGSFSEIFWGDVKKVYRQLLAAMEEPRPDIETLCSSSELDENGVSQAEHAPSLCQDIMKVYYFMDGIPTADAKPAAAPQTQDQIHPFMRCMVGYVILAKKFAPLCDFNALMPYARKATDAMRPRYQVDTSNSACNGLNLDSLRIGHKLVGATIKEWIEENSSRWADIMEDYMDDTCAEHSTIAAGSNSGQDTQAETEQEGAIGTISVEDLKRLADSRDELSKHAATTVLNQIQGLNDGDDIMKRLRDAIAEVESAGNINVAKEQRTRSRGTHTTSSSSGSSSSSSSSPSGTSESAPATSATAAIVPASTPSKDTSGAAKPAAKEAATTQPVPAGAATSGTASAPGAQTQAPPQQPASPVLPATDTQPPAAPPSTSGAGSAGGSGGQGPGPGQQPPPPQPPQSQDPAGKHERTPNNHQDTATGEYTCPHEKSKNPHAAIESHAGSRVSITKGHYTPEGQPSCEKINELLRTQHSPATNFNPTDKKSSGDTKDVTPPDHKKGVSQSPELTPGPAPSPASPEAQPELPAQPETPVATDPAASDPTSPSTGTETTSTGKGGDGSTSDTKHAVAIVDGGNDDPPPLNPPKPKPNPDQTASSSGADKTTAGVDPDKHCTNKGEGHGCDLMLAVPFEPTTNLSDGHFGLGATPAIRDLNKDGVRKEDVPLDVPDLTNAVLTATTPVLFFLSAVTVALLGYSLWKGLGFSV
ncbi:hypothetical protein AK88_01865 [Plasmodium fragile]|uniref:Schizont-infected cell agglutination extracellular alpha domain-containing protein n=1 Tax=Plasmodium fragile TaxID=5857 RepID=A0A0D9QNA5_PLAFR|nr:uncharacterized protein AK88_01865 [Plasmodium fragile]KJP88413.1 hypothetical protein AK88_01865 [Plasmodium fragile]